MKKKHFRRFNVILMPLVAFNLLAIAFFNLVVDPYGVLSSLNSSDIEQSKLESTKLTPVSTSPPKSGSNVNKPVVKSTPPMTLIQRSKYRAERFKLNLSRLSITRINPKTIVLGTSTALRLSTDHPALTKQPVYNLGLAGAKMHDIRIYFEDILANHPDLNQVVIGLDFYSFGRSENKIRTPQPITATNPIVDETSIKPTTEVRRNKYSVSLEELLKINFSLDTFNASVQKVVKNSIPNKPINKNPVQPVSHQETPPKSEHTKFSSLQLNLKFNANAIKPLKKDAKTIKSVKQSAKVIKSVEQSTKNDKPIQQTTQIVKSIKKTENIVKPVKKIVRLKASKKLSHFRRVIDSYYREKTFYKNYVLSQEELNNFKSILDTCKKKNITIKIFFSPVHASQLEAIYTAGLWSDFEEWKRQVIAMTPAWDFSDYSSITTEPINNNMENFVDSVHYDEQIGDLILNRLYNYHKERVPSSFGFLITSSNLESHLAKIRAERQNWLKNNQATVQFVQDIKKQITSK